MVFFLLLYQICSFSPHLQFSILAPIEQTNISEIGAWSTRGSAINMKQYIRLTSLKNSDYGGLCLRKRSYFNDWKAEVTFGFENDQSNFIQTIYYTNEFCPETSLIWNGFAVRFNISRDRKQNQVTLMSNDGRIIGFNTTSVCNFSLLGFEKEFTAQITYFNSTFSVLLPNKQQCSSGLSNVSFGYYTINSYTYGTALKNDLKQFLVYPLSSFIESFNMTEEDMNRKSLQKDAKTHGYNKRLRRASMPKISYFKEQLDFQESQLHGFPNDLKNSFIETNELIQRAGQGLSTHELQSFIESIVVEKTDRLLKSFESSLTSLNEIKEELKGFWFGTTEILKVMSSETKQQLLEIETEAKAIANDILKNGLDFNEENTRLNTIEDPNRSRTMRFLSAVSLLETIGYIAFFLVKRRITGGFSKYD